MLHPSLRSFIINALRRAWGRSWAKRECLNRAKSECSDGSRHRVHFLCATCGSYHYHKAIQVDHIIPVMGLAGFDTWEGVIERMFCGPDSLQVLCKSCHKKKSAEEAGVRAKVKRERKPAKTGASRPTKRELSE